MRFDNFSIVLLVRRADAPRLDEQAADALQDAHLAYLADLHDAGHLLAVGPLGGDGDLRGLSIMAADVERARELAEADPAVRAGRFSATVLPWMVPTGAMEFKHTRIPRSMADVHEEPTAPR